MSFKVFKVLFLLCLELGRLATRPTRGYSSMLFIYWQTTVRGDSARLCSSSLRWCEAGPRTLFIARRPPNPPGGVRARAVDIRT